MASFQRFQRVRAGGVQKNTVYRPVCPIPKTERFQRLRQADIECSFKIRPFSGVRPVRRPFSRGNPGGAGGAQDRSHRHWGRRNTRLPGLRCDPKGWGRGRGFAGNAPPPPVFRLIRLFAGESPSEGEDRISNRGGGGAAPSGQARLRSAVPAPYRRRGRHPAPAGCWSGRWCGAAGRIPWPPGLLRSRPAGRSSRP